LKASKFFLRGGRGFPKQDGGTIATRGGYTNDPKTGVRRVGRTIGHRAEPEVQRGRGSEAFEGKGRRGRKRDCPKLKIRR